MTVGSLGSFLARGLIVGAPILICSLYFLWTTGYPASLWAQVTVLFFVCVSVWEFALGYAILAVLSKTMRYGRRVMRAHGKEIHLDEDTQRPTPRVRPGLSHLITLVVFLASLTGAVWGLAIFSLHFGLLLMSTPLPTPDVYIFARWALGLGATVLLLFLGLPALLFWLASVQPKAELPDSWEKPLASAVGAGTTLNYTPGSGAILNLIRAMNSPANAKSVAYGDQ